MRMDKWNIWIDTILHLRYELIVYKENKQLLSYNYPSNKFDTGIVKYDKVIDTKDDPYKKIIKIIMIMENINKNNLRSKEVDDYTVNNMMTTINGNKSLSAQLFSRFIRMAELSYIVNMYDLHGKDIIFQYKEWIIMIEYEVRDIMGEKRRLEERIKEKTGKFKALISNGITINQIKKRYASIIKLKEGRFLDV